MLNGPEKGEVADILGVLRHVCQSLGGVPHGSLTKTINEVFKV